MESCCFIDAAKYQLGRKDSIDHLDEKEEHIKYCIKMLEAAERGFLRLLTGSLTISECSHLSGATDDEVKRLFRSILSSGRVVKLVTDSIFIAERARDLRWNHNIRLSGADATHVATALEAGCEEFITYDSRIHKYASEIEKLGIRVIKAYETKLLAAYLTEDTDLSNQRTLFAEPNEGE